MIAEAVMTGIAWGLVCTTTIGSGQDFVQLYYTKAKCEAALKKSLAYGKEHGITNLSYLCVPAKAPTGPIPSANP